MASNQISAVSIKRLWYCDPIEVSPTKDNLMGEVTKVENVHQDTWTLEESEPSQDSYKNQLTGLVYRMGRKEMGEITANFTIGRYDYVLKQSFMGGLVHFSDGSVSKETDTAAEIAAKVAPVYKYKAKDTDGKFVHTGEGDSAVDTIYDTKELAEAAGTPVKVNVQTNAAVGWSRARGSVEVRKTLYALTDDDQLCILPYVNLNAHEGDSDGAIGIVIQGMALDPKTDEVMPEYWFDCSDKTQYAIDDSGIKLKA